MERDSVLDGGEESSLAPKCGCREVEPGRLSCSGCRVPVAEVLVEIIWTLELEVIGNQLHLALNPVSEGNDPFSGRH